MVIVGISLSGVAYIPTVIDIVSNSITVGILIGLVVGAIVGEVLYRAYDGSVPDVWIEGLSFVGKTFFMGLLKMVLIPLIASSVIVGVASIGDPSKLGFVGFSTLSIAAAQIVGPAIGGALIDQLGYRSIFPAAAAFMLAGFVILQFISPRSGDS